LLRDFGGGGRLAQSAEDRGRLQYFRKNDLARRNVRDLRIAVAPLKSDQAALYLLQKRAVHGRIEAAQGLLNMREKLIPLNAFQPYGRGILGRVTSSEKWA
jgi:hypothetical protein